MTAIQTGYIRSPRADFFWFVTLPFIGIAFALASQRWLTFVALASVNLWVTVPHHFGTWSRAYGLKEDWDRFRVRLTLGPIVIVAAVVAALLWAPLTIFLVTLLWDAQHSVMQQHGLARIYDFKAKTGAPSTGRMDLWLNLVLFGNHLITAPLWTETWVHQLYIWKVPIEAPMVRAIQASSYILTVAYVACYVAYLLRCMAAGYRLNPIKYLFLGSSYFLWYYAAWNTNSVLVYGIAHRIMHGLQYFVIVYWYLERKAARTGEKSWMLPKLDWMRFAATGAIYALLFQLLLLRPLDEFGFGLINLVAPPEPISIEESLSSIKPSYEIYAATIINSTAILHYYFDSFIWKVRDEKTQEGL